MSISPVKRSVLEAMWMFCKPAKPKEIAKETGLGFPRVMMHIIGLTRMGYVRPFEKGYYVITGKGREALGFPELDKERAEQILAYTPMEKSFHFFVDVGKPLNIHASSLQDFCDKISKVNVDSIEFHIHRRDFEAWFMGLGDLELARKTMLIREKGIHGEELRKKLFETVKNRCDELARISNA